MRHRINICADVKMPALGGLVRVRVRSASQASAQLAFLDVLRQAVGDRLPLHVRSGIGPAGAQRDDVVDDVARARAAPVTGRGAGVRALELEAGGGGAWSSLSSEGYCQQQANAQSFHKP